MYPPAVAQRLADVCLPVFSSCVHLTSAHLILHQRNTICERFTTCMRRVVVISSRGPSTRGRFTIDRRSISRLTSDLLSTTSRRTPVLLTEHVDTKVSRSRSTNQGSIRNLRSNHICPNPAISSPVSIQPFFRAAMQEIVKFHAIEHFNVNVTHAEKPHPQ